MRRPRKPLAVLVGLSTMAATCGGGDRELVGYTRDTEPDVDIAEVPDLSQDGAPFRFVAEPDGLLVVFIGYTNCPDVCPTTLAELKRALGELGDEDAERISTVMLSIDPEHDRDTVTEYIQSFVPGAHAVALDDQALLQELTLAFGVSYRVTERPDGDVEVSHSEITLFAVDDSGTLVLTWPSGIESDDLAADLEQLLDERA